MKILAIPTLLLAIATLGTTGAIVSRWMPAVVSKAGAIADGNGFTLSATVELPQPKACFNVRIVHLAVPNKGAHYVVQQRRNEKMCTEVITPYVVVFHVAAATVPKNITILALTPLHHLVPMIVPITHP